jgi:hypothetical protein
VKYRNQRVAPVPGCLHASDTAARGGGGSGEGGGAQLNIIRKKVLCYHVGSAHAGRDGGEGARNRINFIAFESAFSICN